MLNNNNCPICFSRNKIVLGDYVINTRIPKKKKVTLKQIHHNQCSVCDYKELTEESAKLVESMNNFYINEYENLEEDTSIFSGFRNRRG